MQKIQLKKFGNILVSRSDGLEAFKAILPQLDPNTLVEIDFSDVLTVTPSWLDEFLIRLTDFNNGKVDLLPTNNPSVLITLPVLAKARKDLVADVINKYMDKMGIKRD